MDSLLLLRRCEFLRPAGRRDGDLLVFRVFGDVPVCRARAADLVFRFVNRGAAREGGESEGVLLLGALGRALVGAEGPVVVPEGLAAAPETERDLRVEPGRGIRLEGTLEFLSGFGLHPRRLVEV